MMNLRGINQLTLNEALLEPTDIVICASGFESRATHLAKKLSTLNCRLVALGFKEFKDKGARDRNDRKYVKYAFEQFELSGNDDVGAGKYFQDFLNAIDKENCRLVIDISSMTRAWYGGFVSVLRSESKFNKITSDFVYVPAKFPTKFPEYPPNEVVAPVKGFSGLTLNDKPTALIIGLGHEEGRAIGIKEELDPDLTVVFLANPAIDNCYVKRLLEVNSDFLETIDSEFQFNYPIKDALTTFSMLESISTGLMRNYNVVLTSLGPKIFGLFCFLLAAKYPELSVWRVSAGTFGNVMDHKPSKSEIIMRTIWTKA